MVFWHKPLPLLYLLFTLALPSFAITDPVFIDVYKNATGGVAGYDLLSTADKVIAFDYKSSGDIDTLVLYRPGEGAIFIVPPTLTAVYHEGDPGAGIGGYDLKSTADLIIPFDFDSSGKMDHLVLYRPGSGLITILKNTDGSFSPVFNSSSGIGGFDLLSTADLGFAFDYLSVGKQDHLCIIRPGTGTIWILSNSGGTFTPVFKQGDPGIGIGGFPIDSPYDRAFAFDFTGSGNLDHLFFYTPGAQRAVIIQNNAGTFTPVFNSTTGFAGFDLLTTADQAFAYDYAGTGQLTAVALYRPGAGAFFIATKATDTTYTAVYAQGAGGSGIGTYDLASPNDRALAFDFSSSHKMNFLALYRPGAGAFFIMDNANNTSTSETTTSTSPGPTVTSTQTGMVTVTSASSTTTGVGAFTAASSQTTDTNGNGNAAIGKTGVSWVLLLAGILLQWT